jgi:hypothetical protein
MPSNENKLRRGEREVDKIARAVKGVAYMNSEVRSDEMAAT